MSKFLIGAAAVAVLVLGSSVAVAKPTSKKIETTEAGNDYGYKFEDDLLAGGVMGAESGMIKVRQGVVRRTLIRPRTHFVPELLKSIEQI